MPLSRERVAAGERKAVLSCTRQPEMFIHPRYLAVNESAVSHACRPWPTLQNMDNNEEGGVKAMTDLPIKTSVMQCLECHSYTRILPRPRGNGLTMDI